MPSRRLAEPSSARQWREIKIQTIPPRTRFTRKAERRRRRGKESRRRRNKASYVGPILSPLHTPTTYAAVWNRRLDYIILIMSL